jgi:phosphoglycolate phosphatase-like HAD superfamily hydrolase
LFDIDGTLVLTGGAGSRAMGRAFEEVYRVANAFDGVAVSGRTDHNILVEVFERAGVAPEPAPFAAFCERYYEHLALALAEPHPQKGVMPGVRALLDALAPRRDVFVGLLTGNFAPSARLKLEHFDLWQYFPWGAFGDDAADRNGLLPVAVARARANGAPAVAPDRVIVVGDTPLDVACAAASGARAVAVATGSADAATLQACGADVVFEDLSDTRAFLALLA